MKQNDVQVGSPSILYKDTKSNIAEKFAIAGQIAYTTDTNEFGCYNGSSWAWSKLGNPPSTTIEVDLGSIPRSSGKFNITSSGLTEGKSVVIQQASGPYTGKGTRTDEAEMDSINVLGKVTSATNIECFWSSRNKVKKNFKFNYFVSA